MTQMGHDLSLAARHRSKRRTGLDLQRHFRSVCLALAAAAAALLAAGSAHALTVTGSASALNAYAFTVDGYEVYLLGVDSVERNQTCLVDRQSWDCGVAAIRHLEEVLYEGAVICETVFGPDADNRVIALCELSGADLGARLVS